MHVLKVYMIALLNLIGCSLHAQQHPVAYFTRADIAFIKAGLNNKSLLQSSFNDIKASVDKSIGKDIDVPFPKDAAGGYTHEQHKANYLLMFNSGMLYQLTGDTKYARLVKNLFVKYAALNPTLKNHPQATSSSPGRIFWQALNDANWLVYAGLAFDCIHDYLTVDERKKIAEGAFKPEVDFFTHDLKDWFNLIHNHAVWAGAGVGIAGIATDNNNWLQMALYGTQKDGKAGFLANMDGLFSPDGYYTEGPYYLRYAILPFYLFANALQNEKPALKIFERRNRILQKALTSALQQTNLNGGFYSYNDALKDKTFVSNEIVEAVDIAWKVYGADRSLLPVAKIQNRVTVSRGGAAVAVALQQGKNIPNYYPYKSIEFTDGANGDKGGVSILRAGREDGLVSLIYKYTSHGLSHGHYDKLNINLYDGDNEILTDYGAVRFVGIEQKYGGRYLPETKGYASQTIAHNTIVVDETSHFNAKEDVSEKFHPEKMFGNIQGRDVQVISARDDKAYNGISLHRTLYMLQIPGCQKPLIVDLYRALSTTKHQYDLPFQYAGMLMSTSFKYKAFTGNQTTLGNKNGYQYLWKEAEAKATGPFSQFTFLINKAFYSISTLTDDSTFLYFTRTGANDPDFNLRREPAWIIRKNGANKTFISTIEIHGNYSPLMEVSSSAYSSVQQIELIQDDENFSVAKITVNKKILLIAQCNKDFGASAKHVISGNDLSIQWTGPYTVLYGGEKLK